MAQVQRPAHCLQQFSNKVKSLRITGALNPGVQRPVKRERQAWPSRRQSGVCTAVIPREGERDRGEGALQFAIKLPESFSPSLTHTHELSHNGKVTKNNPQFIIYESTGLRKRSEKRGGLDGV